MEIFDSEIIEKILKNDRKTGDYSVAESCPQPMGEFPIKTPIGMCYVPMQVWEHLYDDAMGLERGTIFKDLDKPFLGERGVYDDK